MRDKTASIVITNYNYGRFLRRCIDSALSQTHASTEVVVVDDASQDDSPEIIRSYGDRISPVVLKVNGGQGAAFNAGFAACKGDVVFFLDADDWLYSHAVSRALEAFAPGVAQVQFRLHLVDAKGTRIDVLPPPEVRFDRGDVVPLLLQGGRFENTVTSGNAFSRAALNSVLPVPAETFRISADGYLVTVVPLYGRVEAIEEPLGAYSWHGSNLWTGALGCRAEPAKFRRSLLHDEERYAALRKRVTERGLSMADEPGLADAQHLTNRIASLTLDPGRHPYAADSRVGLALKGAEASCTARLPRRRRLVLAAWFLGVGLAPRPVATRLISWRLDSGARPPHLARAMQRLRRWTQ